MEGRVYRLVLEVGTLSCSSCRREYAIRKTARNTNATCAIPWGWYELLATNSQTFDFEERIPAEGYHSAREKRTWPLLMVELSLMRRLSSAAFAAPKTDVPAW